YANNRWNLESLQIVKHLLAGKGLNTKDVNGLLAYHIQRPWVLVIKPFQPEYPGDREWNRDAPRFKVQPSTSDNLHYPTWQSMLNHIGKSLDEHVRRTTWAQRNGITTGADYLKCWIASMIQYPQEPLPYLFIYGAKQATGKSTFH